MAAALERRAQGRVQVHAGNGVPPARWTGDSSERVVASETFVASETIVASETFVSSETRRKIRVR